MPLKRGYSKSSIGKNLKTLTGEGKSRKQALAISLGVAHEAAKKAGRPEKSPKARKGKGKARKAK